MRGGGNRPVRAMPWVQMQQNLRELKVRILDRWRGGNGNGVAGAAPQERREKWVERIQRLARDEVRGVQEPETRIKN